MRAALVGEGTVLQDYPPVISRKGQPIFLAVLLTVLRALHLLQDECTRLQNNVAFFCLSVKQNLRSIPYGETSSQQLFPEKQLLWEIFGLFSPTTFRNNKTGSAHSLKLILIVVRNQIIL